MNKLESQIKAHNLAAHYLNKFAPLAIQRASRIRKKGITAVNKGRVISKKAGEILDISNINDIIRSEFVSGESVFAHIEIWNHAISFHITARVSLPSGSNSKVEKSHTICHLDNNKLVGDEIKYKTVNDDLSYTYVFQQKEEIKKLEDKIYKLKMELPWLLEYS